MTLYSDAYDGDPDTLDKYGVQLSNIFKSPALCTSCFDSDFYFCTSSAQRRILMLMQSYIDKYNANRERTRKYNSKIDDMLLD